MFPLEFRGQFLSSICICRGFLMITSEWTLKVAAGNQLFGLNQTAFCQERSNICFVHRCDTQLKVSVTLICHHCGVTTWDVCQAPQPANCDEALCHREAARGLDDPDLQIANPHAAIYIYAALTVRSSRRCSLFLFAGASVHDTALWEASSREGCGNCVNDTAQESAFVLDALILPLKKVPLYSACNLI